MESWPTHRLGARCCGAAGDLFGGGPEMGLLTSRACYYVSVTFKLGHKRELLEPQSVSG